MGDGRDKQKRGSDVVASEIVSGTFSPTEVIGQRTLTGDLDSPSGDEYIDHHPRCTDHIGHDCFLSSDQRAKLIEDYKIRVAIALDAYQRALDQIRVDKLLTQDKADLPWVATLLLEVAGAKALSGLISALRMLKTEQLSDLGRIVNLDPDAVRRTTAVASRTYIGLAMTTDEQLSELSKGAFDKGKDKALEALKAELDHEREDEKASALSYIARLKAMAADSFEELRLKPPGYATDAQLLVLWNGFNPHDHTDEVYKEALEEKLVRYQKSGVSEIGRRDGLRPVAEGSHSSVTVKRDTVVVRIRFKSGYPERFAYARRDWAHDSSNTLPSERAEEASLPLDESRWHGHAIPSQARYSQAPEFERFIDPEFVSVALERHLQIWGKEPEVIEADDGNWAWDQRRVQMARENKSREPGPFGMPRLKLRDVRSGGDEDVVIPEELVLKEGSI